MNKKIFPLIIGIVIILIIGGYFVFFKGKTKKAEYQPSEGYQAPQETPIKTEENVYKIKGLGFKKEAWAEYKIEGYGLSFKGDTEERKIGKILVKFIYLPIKGKEYYGIEMDGLKDSPFEGVYFAVLFEKDGKGNYYLIKMKGVPTMCMKEAISGYENIPEYFDRKSFEEEYKVDLSTWSFVGEEEITLESGKKIKVFKFKFKSDIGTYGSRDLWLSPDVPTYLVLNKEILEGVSRLIALTNFGMDGGLPNFTNEDLKVCDGESWGGFPQLPSNLPSEVSKLFCQTDFDCACGVDKETGKCSFGNKNFIDTSKQCPDFCTGFAGNIRIKCVNNLCSPQIVR